MKSTTQAQACLIFPVLYLHLVEFGGADVLLVQSAAVTALFESEFSQYAERVPSKSFQHPFPLSMIDLD